MEIPKEITREVEKWLHPPFDSTTRKEVETLLKSDPEELVDAFYRTIPFGTAGMRGLMGAGPNRMNRYTVGRATQGLANYITRRAPDHPHKVFISYDSRHHSKEFAEECASVLAGNGIASYITKELRPTPLVSFGCRHLRCTAAVMITASHNPSLYNGYKVYWSDGAQVVPPHDVGITCEVKEITDQNSVQKGSLRDPLIREVSEELDTAYLRALSRLRTRPHDEPDSPPLSIVYSSLHGTGGTLIHKALRDRGFDTISSVKRQSVPDGDFPYAPSPNPEDPEAMKEGTEQLILEDKDLLLATDPDADRIGVVVNRGGTPVPLTGNQIAAICAFYLGRTLKARGDSLKEGVIITTIVTTGLLREIARFFGIRHIETLTGFKYIGEQIRIREETGTPFSFVFGAEESFGYLYGTYARDKDGVGTAALLAEIAAEAKTRGETLCDLLAEIYRTFGLFSEKQRSVPFEPGPKGMASRQNVTETLRRHPPKAIGGVRVTAMEDYGEGIRRNVTTGEESALTLPASDVLLFLLEDQSRVIIRPSGTEPKVKIYGMVRDDPPKGDIDTPLATCRRRLDTLLEATASLAPLNP
ncbi:MAG: phospho-sugar mutase [Simkaniaceae bacterium]|nr:phospho-sugar mutase [Simkaniaceae bacterium]